MEYLSENLRNYFQNNDGTYPEICIAGLNGDDVVNFFEKLIKDKPQFVGSPYFFDCRDWKDKSIFSVENAAKMVVDGLAEPFHFLVRNLVVDGGVIPEIGIFIFPNAIAIDFEKGQVWKDQQINALFSFIAKIIRLSPNSVLHLEDDAPFETRELLFQAISKFLEEN